MAFDTEKNKYLDALYKPDRSKKGSVDKEISHVIDKINSLPDYYTTSSCAGRIVLIKIPKNTKRKDEAEWLFVSHKRIKPKDLPLDKKFPKETVWFRMESAILHICCKDMGSANRILVKAKHAGFKRSGIMGTNKRIMAALISTESVDVPIADKGKLIVTKEYIDFLVKEANKKLKKTREKTEKLYKSL